MVTKQDVLDVVGEKWIVNYDLDAHQMMVVCRNYNALPELIKWIRQDGAKNICIKDQTIFFVDGEEND